MSTKRTFFLVHDEARRNAVEFVKAAPEGWCVEVKQRTRTLDQNARMWAMLTELSRQVVWHDQHLTPENWKDMCTAALKRQQVVPGIDGGFVVLGTSTRRMTIGEMAELMDFIAAFGAERGVAFHEPVEVDA